MAFLVYVILATGFLLGALYFTSQGQKRAREELVEQRLATVGMQRINHRRTDWLSLQLERAGITLDETKRRIIGLGLATLVLLVGFRLGVVAGLMLLAFFAVVIYSALAALYSRRQSQIVSQLPRLLDQVVRMMRTGKTIGDAFFVATDDAEQPLKAVMEKLRRNITLGMSIPEAFADLAETYGLQELRVLSLGIGVNARFGGSLVDLLNNVIMLIQQREKAVRQLKAMTGETRVSALLLSILPLLLGGFMLVSNPNYLNTMLEDSTGQTVLISAGVAQLLGMLVIWRMLRSI